MRNVDGGAATFSNEGGDNRSSKRLKSAGNEWKEGRRKLHFTRVDIWLFFITPAHYQKKLIINNCD